MRFQYNWNIVMDSCDYEKFKHIVHHALFQDICHPQMIKWEPFNSCDLFIFILFILNFKAYSVFAVRKIRIKSSNSFFFFLLSYLLQMLEKGKEIFEILVCQKTKAPLDNAHTIYATVQKMYATEFELLAIGQDSRQPRSCTVAMPVSSSNSTFTYAVIH